MPKENNQQLGHKFPFNACEILCSLNGFNINRIMDLTKEKKDKEKKEIEENRKKNIEKDYKIEVNNIVKEMIDKIESSKKEKNEEKEERINENNKDETKENLEKNIMNSPKNENIPHHQKNKAQIQEGDFDGEFIDDDNDNDNDLEKEKEIALAKAELEALENDKEDYSDLYDLFDYLFKFLDEEPSDDNYVLMGYFAKIINNLLKVNPEILINYIYDDHPIILQKLLKHINRKAIGVIFENIIMNINNMFGNKDNIITSCKYLIDALNNENVDENGFEVIYDVLVNSIINCNKQSFHFFISNEGILEKLNEIFEKFTLKNEEMKIINLLKLQIKINDEILNNFKKKITPNFNNDQAENEITSIIRALDKGGDIYSSLTSIKNDDIYYGENIIYTNPERLIKYLNKSCKVIIDDIMKEDEDKKEKCLVNAFSDEKIKKLGIKNYYEYECLKTILDLYINFYQNDNLIDNLNSSLQIIVDSKIFEKMIKIYFDYPMNNLYQNLFDQIIQISINAISPEILINSIFKINSDSKQNLIYLIIQNIVNLNEFKFEKSNNKMRPILLASNTNILKNIFSSENKYLKSIYENDNSIKIFSSYFIPRVSEQFEKKLMQETKESDFGKAEFINPNYDSQEIEEDIPFSTRSLSDLVSAQIEIYKTFLKGGDDYLELIKKEDEIIEKNKSKSQINKKENDINNDDKNDKNKDFDSEENLYAFDYNKEINLNLDDIDLHKKNFGNEDIENEKYFDNNYWSPSLNNFDDIEDIIEDL